MKKEFETTYQRRKFKIQMFPLDKEQAVKSGAVTEKFTQEYPYVMQVTENGKLLDTRAITTDEFHSIDLKAIHHVIENDIDRNTLEGLELINEDETEQETMQFIESKRNWDVANQRYRKPEAEKCKANLADCKIYQRGKYFILEHNNIIHYWEHEGQYCYILDAIEYMKPEIPAPWKTLDRLITFRQAIRECTAQGMGLEDLYQFDEGITFEQYKEFIKVARVYDKRHHGSVTF